MAQLSRQVKDLRAIVGDNRKRTLVGCVAPIGGQVKDQSQLAATPPFLV